MGALGESRYGNERGTPILVYVKVEMGIGAGIIIKDQLYCGTGAAGELGHVIVVKENGEVVHKADFLVDSLKHAAQESSLHVSWHEVQIKPCTLDWPVVVGAIDNAINRISNPSL